MASEALRRANMLERVLVKRFGKIPSAHRAAMASADTAQLDAWFDRAIDAGSIEGVLPGEHLSGHS